MPGDLLAHCAAHLRAVDLEVEETPSTLSVPLPQARVDLRRDAAGFSVEIEAGDAPALQQLREYLLSLLDHVMPGAVPTMEWSGDIARNTRPPNFHLARFHSVRRVARRFLRVTLDCEATGTLEDRPGMHFSLLLPPPGRDAAWPMLDDNGRTRWPGGPNSLHRAVYTFVALDRTAGRFTFDVFEHAGGRVAAWVQVARRGDAVGIMGPGSGELPVGDNLLIAGDETALPAIRAILAQSPAHRHGRVLVEVESADDMCDLLRPRGMSLDWVLRDRGDRLWRHLRDAPVPAGPSRHVWIAAEQALVRRAKQRFRAQLDPGEGYFAYYWTAG